MDPWVLALLPNEKMQKLIDNCEALKLDPELKNRSYVYTTAERKYSQIWTKEDVLDGETIYYYYKIQIVGLCKDGYNEEGNYLFVQNWGAFDTINHRKRLDYLPLTQCLQKYVIQSAERSRNFIFAKIKENDISKSPLHRLVQELIIKYIFDINFLNKMIDEYTFDVKNTISAFFDVTKVAEVKNVKPQHLPRHWSQAAPPRMPYDKACELLQKTITCQPTDMNEGQSKTFSLMNFYYKQLHTTINVLDKDTERYTIIEQYFQNSQSSRHSYSSMRMELTNVFEIERPCDNHRYTKHLTNKQLLWHGTCISNIPSILYEGFRTSKARSSGMFGAGTYFANSVSKSLGYCETTNEGILLLCEVALGDTLQRTHSMKGFVDNLQTVLPDGKNSVHGVGMLTPNPCGNVTIDVDVLVPCGSLRFDNNHSKTSLVHDEFIVYNPAQIKMRYLITMTYS